MKTSQACRIAALILPLIASSPVDALTVMPDSDSFKVTLFNNDIRVATDLEVTAQNDDPIIGKCTPDGSLFKNCFVSGSKTKAVFDLGGGANPGTGVAASGSIDLLLLGFSGKKFDLLFSYDTDPFFVMPSTVALSSQFNVSLQAVPLPASLPLLAAALGLMAALRRLVGRL